MFHAVILHVTDDNYNYNIYLLITGMVVPLFSRLLFDLFIYCITMCVKRVLLQRFYVVVNIGIQPRELCCHVKTHCQNMWQKQMLSPSWFGSLWEYIGNKRKCPFVPRCPAFRQQTLCNCYFFSQRRNASASRKVEGHLEGDYVKKLVHPSAVTRFVVCTVIRSFCILIADISVINIALHLGKYSH